MGIIARRARALFVSSAPLFAQGRLSHSLQKHVASKSTQTVDVIVHGSPDEIRAIAARHGLRIKKTLLEGAVMQATAAGIEALAADVDHLSRDIDVASFMSVSNAAIGADQVQAGLDGPAAVHRRRHRHRADRLGRLDRPPLARRPRRVFEGFRRRRCDLPGQGGQ